MLTTFVSFLHIAIFRISTLTRPSAFASRIARLAVDMEIPATAAMRANGHRHPPGLQASTATTARAACSPAVNLAAMAGGIRPDAAHRRRRSREASVRGLDPRLVVVGFTNGTSWRAWINPDSSSASTSSTCPSATAFHSTDATAGKFTRGAIAIARFNSSTNTASPPGRETHRREAAHTGHSSAIEENHGFPLARHLVFGEDQDANLDRPRPLCRHVTRPRGGFRVSGPLDRRHFDGRTGTIAAVSSRVNRSAYRLPGGSVVLPSRPRRQRRSSARSPVTATMTAAVAPRV